mgnify:CR=1 FL=1
MSELPASDNTVTKVWHDLLTKGDIEHTRLMRRLYKLLPREPRCAHCNRPFKGFGGFLVRHVAGIQPSKLNPRYCNDCEVFAKKHPGGAEVQLAMVFADVRGSTGLAERLGTREFTHLIDRFYQTTSEVMIRADALIEKLIGDEVTALFVPGYAGADYTRRAIEAAQEVLRLTGHADPQGPWAPVGIGVHQGRAFVGAIGAKQDIIEITALGDAVNIGARLGQSASPGEILISADACGAAPRVCETLERRDLAIKGHSQTLNVGVMRITPP